MKNSPFAPQRVVRTLTLVAGVLGVAFVAAPPAAEAGGLPAPHEVVRDLHRLAVSHVRRVSRFVDHSVGFREDDRRSDYRRYPSRDHDRRYYRPYRSYNDGGYRSYRSYNGGCYRPYRSYYGGSTIGGYIGRPSVGIVVGVRPGRRTYRDDDCDRNRYRNDDRRRYDDDRRRYDNDDDEDDD
jgi:hypothetical protein